MSERTRLSFEVPAPVKARLERLATTQDTSYTEVLRRAINLLELVTERQEQGAKMIRKHADGTEETIILL